MALFQRLESLKKRHAQIESQLREEETHRSHDVALIQQLKREKLILKDEISRLDIDEEQAA